MKVSFDLDGTALEYPALLAPLWRSLKASGHTVGVLTGWIASEEAEQRCAQELICRGYPAMDFFLARTPEYASRNGAVFKLAMIAEHSIDLHFDDMDFGHADTIRLFTSSPLVENVVRIHCERKR